MTEVSTTTRPPYQLDHVALAVRNLEQARGSLERALGYRARTSPVVNSRQQVRVQFMSRPGSIDIKLIEPSDPGSPLIEFLRRGGGLHHLAFRTESVVAGVADLSANGARIVAQPAPGEAFDDSLIAFAFLPMGLNLELIETDARRQEMIPGAGS